MRLFFPTKVIGRRNVPKKGACVLVGNHRSNWDAVVLACCLHRKLYTIGKRSLFKTRFGAWLFKTLGSYPVSRGVEGSDLGGIKFGLSTLKKGKVFVVFPEGRRVFNQEEELSAFKNGAALFAVRAQVPIIPFVFKRSPGFLKRNVLEYGMPISVEGKNKNDYDEIMSNVNEVMKNMLEKLNAPKTKKNKKN